MTTAPQTVNAATAAGTLLHPFDDALVLERAGEHCYLGRTTPAYWNMIGPFGGITAATLLQAALRHPERLGDPLALTVNFAGPIAEGPFEIEARPTRTNRSTQHWQIALRQGDAVATTATVVFSVRRETWACGEASRPEAPPAHEVPPMAGFAPVRWLKSYDMRPFRGAKPTTEPGTEHPDSLTQFWLRDEPARTPDFAAVAAWCDSFYPRIFLKRAGFVPAGTVSLTTYFHADAATLAALGDSHVLCSAQAQVFRQGFFDQSAQVWSAGGELLATSHQIVYYKE
ncbi:thioesterase family protein [Cupriavidus pinatubonensis]|uniref:acyl-CoA thioesterase n=1 Tax=Cupriavidus pinatubonensis TaxID=248026 RepID=UPI00112AAB45|nr:thioesterase family protein [Cupriavidus pinatubonensis]QYY31812.1 thioesterase family protein [Cupriavidus pinatubonensis]TPQ42117.1 acyl-CoA thioesterase [Cupriavidus pinatubonensis]